MGSLTGAGRGCAPGSAPWDRSHPRAVARGDDRWRMAGCRPPLPLPPHPPRPAIRPHRDRPPRVAPPAGPVVQWCGHGVPPPAGGRLPRRDPCTDAALARLARPWRGHGARSGSSTPPCSPATPSSRRGSRRTSRPGRSGSSWAAGAAATRPTASSTCRPCSAACSSPTSRRPARRSCSCTASSATARSSRCCGAGLTRRGFSNVFAMNYLTVANDVRTAAAAAVGRGRADRRGDRLRADPHHRAQPRRADRPLLRDPPRRGRPRAHPRHPRHPARGHVRRVRRADHASCSRCGRAAT